MERKNGVKVEQADKGDVYLCPQRRNEDDRDRRPRAAQPWRYGRALADGFRMLRRGTW